MNDDYSDWNFWPCFFLSCFTFCIHSNVFLTIWLSLLFSYTTYVTWLENNSTRQTRLLSCSCLSRVKEVFYLINDKYKHSKQRASPATPSTVSSTEGATDSQLLLIFWMFLITFTCDFLVSQKPAIENTQINKRSLLVNIFSLSSTIFVDGVSKSKILTYLFFLTERFFSISVQ